MTGEERQIPLPMAGLAADKPEGEEGTSAAPEGDEAIEEDDAVEEQDDWTPMNEEFLAEQARQEEEPPTVPAHGESAGVEAAQ